MNPAMAPPETVGEVRTLTHPDLGARAGSAAKTVSLQLLDVLLEFGVEGGAPNFFGAEVSFEADRHRDGIPGGALSGIYAALLQRMGYAWSTECRSHNGGTWSL